MHRFDNELLGLPLSFQQSIQAQLDTLIYHHEQTMLKYIGKIPSPSVSAEDGIQIDKKKLLDFFLDYQKDVTDKNDPQLYHSIQIVTGIIEYGEQVEHLEKLITSFHSYHENEVSIN